MLKGKKIMVWLLRKGFSLMNGTKDSLKRVSERQPKPKDKKAVNSVILERVRVSADLDKWSVQLWHYVEQMK